MEKAVIITVIRNGNSEPEDLSLWPALHKKSPVGLNYKVHHYHYISFMFLKRTEKLFSLHLFKQLYAVKGLVVNFSIVILCSLALASCDKTKVFEENQQVVDYKWKYEDPKIFVAEIKDTNQHYNLYVNVRHSFQFEWRNAWVKITTTFPDGKSFDKRVNLVLSEPDGHWLGDCLGDNCDMQVVIQQNAIFPKTGKYTFKITQDMRFNPLPAVKSVGMRIEKAQ